MPTQTAVLRYPRFDIKFYTETNEYHVKYDAEDTEYSDDFMGESVISLTTKNALEDDSAVFSIVLAGDVYWDRVLSANDAVVLKITPNEGGDQPENPVLLVGLISEVRLEGDYGENSKMYRITGQSFAKAFIQFELGIIQEVSVVLTDLGWLPDDAQEGVAMSQKSASELADAMVNKFIQYMKYTFKDGGIERFLTWEFDSWTDAERLIDSTPYVNYEGSLKQLLDDITAKPFNELYFDATADEKCQMTMRRTPFDQSDWTKLPAYYATSKDVISESVAINDTEAYSIFNISVDLMDIDSMTLGSFPQYFPALVEKFGYRKLEVQNRYLDGALIGGDGSDTDDADTSATEEDTEAEKQARDTDTTGERTFGDVYNLSMNFLRGKSADKIRVQKDKIVSQIRSVDNRITENMAKALVDEYILAGTVSQDSFTSITGITKDNANEGNKAVKPTYSKVNKFLKDNAKDEVTTLKNKLLTKFKITDSIAVSLASTFLENGGNLSKTKYDEIVGTEDTDSSTVTGTDSKFLAEFTKRLANWYCENPNFYSGDIVVKGSPDYRLGGRLFVQDEQNDELWEYYIESVQHDYSYSKGYTTTLGVTRGLQNGGNSRFHNMWDNSRDFKGGLLGEKSLQDLLDAQEAENEKNGSGSSGSSGGGSSVTLNGGSVATKACEWGRKHSKTESSYRSAYDWGGGRSGRDPFESQPIATDCSSFVWWCYKHAGVELRGGATGMTTWTIDSDTSLKTISAYGQKSQGMLDKMKVGDIIWFDTAGSNTHIGIYCGGNKFVACNGSGYMNESSNAGIIVDDLTSSYWWSVFNGNVKRLE